MKSKKRKSEFLNLLDITELDRDLFFLNNELKYYSDYIKSEIIVPKTFITDLDSLKRYMPISYAFLKGIALRAAVIHDYLYHTHNYDKDIADKVFREAMKVLGVGIIKRNLVYWGVVVGGKPSYEEGPKKLKYYDISKNKFIKSPIIN